MRMDLTEGRMTSVSLSGTERPSSFGDRTSATEGGTDVPPSNHQRVLMTRFGSRSSWKGHSTRNFSNKTSQH
jgi:hypothetical protein